MSLDGTGDDGRQATARARLNDLTEDWTADEGLPDGVSRESVEDLCAEIRSQVEDEIAHLQSETRLSGREAQCFILERTVDESFTSLTRKSIAVYLTIDSGREEWFDTGPINTYINRANEKLEQAKEFVGYVHFPNREELLDDPQLTYLDRDTLRQLKRRAKDGDRTVDDVVVRLLDATKEVLSLEEFVTRYLEERGKENIAQLAIETSTLESFPQFIAHTGLDEPLPEFVRETDHIEIGGKEVEFAFDETADGPQDMHRVTLFASDNIMGMDSCSVEEGLENVQNALEEKTLTLRSLCERALDDLDVEEIIAAPDGSRVEIVMEPTSTWDFRRFDHVKQLSGLLGDGDGRLAGDSDDPVRTTVRVANEPVGFSNEGITVYRVETIGEPVALEDGLKKFES